MNRFALALAVCVALGGAAPKAEAGTIEVDYVLSGTASAAGFLPVGPAGTGTMKLSYTAAGPSPGTILHGPVHLLSFAFGQPVALNMNVPSISIPASLSGSLMYVAPPSGLGSLKSGGGLTIGPFPGTFSGILHCTGVGTGATGCLGGGAPNTIPFTASVAVPVSGSVASIFLAALSPFTGPNPTMTFVSVPIGMLPIGTMPVPLTIPTLVGTEVGRTYVPEPTSSSLLALVLLGMAGGAWGARRARS